jgi:hypothetical protein
LPILALGSTASFARAQDAPSFRAEVAHPRISVVPSAIRRRAPIRAAACANPRAACMDGIGLGGDGEVLVPR